jgi:uncharacterized membrane protein YhiD involved in acid resistance
VLTLSIAALCGLCIYLVYRIFNKGVVYNANFNLLIFMVCIITAFIIITIGVNIVLSLGMVGALSIIRFRAAVKDPLDVGFLFWGVAVGLTAGAQLYAIAIIGTLFIGVAYIVISRVRAEKRGFLLMLRFLPENAAHIEPMVALIDYKLKNKTQTAEWIELIAEIKVKDNNLDFLKPLLESPYALNASVTEYTGEYT